MYRSYEHEAGLNTRLFSSRLPTPDSSNRSDQTSDAGSPRSDCSDALTNRPYMYPPIVAKEQFDQGYPTSDRRDSQIRDPPRTVLEYTLLSSPPRTPTQPSPHEPFLRQTAYKPPGLYPNSNVSTTDCSFGSAMTTGFASATGSPGQGHVLARADTYLPTTTSTADGFYHSSNTTHHYELPPGPNGDRTSYIRPRDMPPPSLHGRTPFEHGLPSRTTLGHQSDYFGHTLPSHFGLQTPRHSAHYDASDCWRSPNSVPRLPSIHAGFVHDSYDHDYPRSPYPVSATDHRVTSGSRYDYAPSVGKARKRSNLPKEAVEAMKVWFERNIDNPYPPEEEKARMASRYGISLTQVSNWYINHRRRDPELKARRDRSSYVRRDVHL